MMAVAGFSGNCRGSFSRGRVNVVIGLAHSTGDEQEILDPGNYGAGSTVDDAVPVKWTIMLSIPGMVSGAQNHSAAKLK